MHPVPDHSPAAAAAEHAALVVALDAGDLAGRDLDQAAALVGTCAGCASLLADLALVRAATAALPAPRRTRDYRLTDADAARLRPSTWGRLLEWLAAPRSSVRPLAGGLAALGIAGLLLATTPGFLGSSASISTTGAPIVAPGQAGGASRDAAGNAQPSAPSSPASFGAAGGPLTVAPSAASSAMPTAAGSTEIRPNGAAPVASAGSSPPAVNGPTPGAAAVPAPSLAAVAVPVPTLAPDAGAITSPAPAGAKAVPPEAAEGTQNGATFAASEPASPDRTVQVVLSMVLLTAGIALLLTNRVLRGRARS